MRHVLEIIRIEEGREGTFGVLRCDKSLLCLTLEPRDEENAQNRSSIPCQQYEVRRVHSPSFGETYQVADVPGRTDVLFHPGNTSQDTRGCILVGSSWGRVKGRRAILGSRQAFASFMDALQGRETAHLTVDERF